MADPIMEKRARVIFRNALVSHYIDGIEAGAAVEYWLRTHRGWLPDPQDTYGDGTPLTQPADEGEDVMSFTPALAMEEAKPLMQRLVDTIEGADPDHILADALLWLHVLSRKRSRSPSPRSLESAYENRRLESDNISLERRLAAEQRFSRSLEDILRSRHGAADENV